MGMLCPYSNYIREFVCNILIPSYIGSQYSLLCRIVAYQIFLRVGFGLEFAPVIYVHVSKITV